MKKSGMSPAASTPSYQGNSVGIGWISMGFVLMSDQVGYGLLSIPSVFQSLGYIGATVAILVLGSSTTYGGLLLSRIRREHPQISSYRLLFQHSFGSKAGYYASICVNLLLFFVMCSSVLVQAQAWKSLFPKICSVYWVIVAAVFSVAILQIRKLPSIGLLSTLNCVILLIPNILILYSFHLYISNGSRPRGAMQAFPSSTVSSFVAILDLLFAFSGHVVFFELMDGMADPLEFPKALYLSQGMTAFVFLFNGMFTYITAGNATWMVSPANLSLQVGVVKTVCDAFIVLYSSLAMLVDGNVFLKHIQCGIQRMNRQDSLFPHTRDELETKKGKVADKRQEFETPVLTFELPTPALSVRHAQSAPVRTRRGFQHRQSDHMQWLLITVGTLTIACVLTLAVGSLNDLIGIIAALVASQTGLSWPGFFYCWIFRERCDDADECYYHGGGTAPCRCWRKWLRFPAQKLLMVCGVCLGVIGFWYNVEDILFRYKSNSQNPFSCSSGSMALVRKYQPRISQRW